jgi:hypothetical protein
VRSTKLTDEARAMGRSVIAKRAADKAADYAPIILEIQATGITSLASITAARSTSAASRPLGCPRDRRSLATQSTLAGPSARWPPAFQRPRMGPDRPMASLHPRPKGRPRAPRGPLGVGSGHRMDRQVVTSEC